MRLVSRKILFLIFYINRYPTNVLISPTNTDKRPTNDLPKKKFKKFKSVGQVHGGVRWLDSEWFPGDEATLVAKSEPTSVLHFNVQIQGMTCISVRPPYIYYIYPPWNRYYLPSASSA